jgi:hypothetical protein
VGGAKPILIVPAKPLVWRAPLHNVITANPPHTWGKKIIKAAVIAAFVIALKSRI